MNKITDESTNGGKTFNENRICFRDPECLGVGCWC